jgi:predicted MFS family arabinose efflux permease
LVAQLTQAAAGLGVILVVQEAGGSLALAGAAAAAFVIGAGGARPIQGRIMDARGPRPVLVASAAVHVAGVAALVAYTQLEGATWIVVPLAIPIGLGEPPVSQGMRIAWGRWTSAEERTAAYSLVTLIQEIAVLLGPLILAAVVAVASAAAGLVVVGVVAGIGALALAALMPTRDRAAESPSRHLALRSAGIRAALAVTVLFAIALGATEVGIPALTGERDVPAVSGLLLAAMSVGGILGAIAYGSRRWRAGPVRTLVALLGLMTIAVAPLIATPGFGLMILPLVLAGVAINPIVTAVALLVEDHSPAVAAEAFGWQSTALALGTAVGNAVAGTVADGHGASAAFAAATLAAALATALALLSRTRLATGQPASPPY